MDPDQNAAFESNLISVQSVCLHEKISLINAADVKIGQGLHIKDCSLIDF